MRIYFAGSIRGGRDDAELYRQLIAELKRFGEVLTDHVGNPEVEAAGSALTERDIHDRDLAWLRSADAVVAEVTTPSLGVGYEVGRAVEWAKPVLAMFRPGSGRILSAMISGCPAVRLVKYESGEEGAWACRTFLAGI